MVTVQSAGFRVCEVDGFTVTNGGRYTEGDVFAKYGLGGLGGGLRVIVSSPRIANNLITHNSVAIDTNVPPPGIASHGAGIYCKLSYATISGNTITENEVLDDFDGSGGGIFLADSMPLIERNVITHNHAERGAAIFSQAPSAPQIVGNLIRSNMMYVALPVYQGSSSSAVTLQQAPDFLIEGNTIQDNTAALGGALSLSGCLAGRVQDNVIAGNRAYDPTAFGGTGGAIYCLVTTNAVQPISIVHNPIVDNVANNIFGEQGGGIAFALPGGADQLIIANNLIASNSSGLYRLPTAFPPDGQPTLANNDLFNLRNNYLNLAAGPNDFSAAPKLVDAEHDDYRLQADSPCIDAGTPLFTVGTDLTGVPRPLDGDHDGAAAPDVGAYEVVHAAADSDHDGMADGWEIAHALNAVADDAALDLDADGAKNLSELIAGTDPSDAKSALRVTIQWAEQAGRVQLRWASGSGRSYQVQFRPELALSPEWQVLEGEWVGTGGVLEAEDQLPPNEHRFYRLSVQGEPPRSRNRAWGP